MVELKEKLRLMRVRSTSNKKRPSFVRNESWRYKKLSKSGWRKQRGIDNKTRRKTKTGIKSPEPGYRGPKSIRGLHPSGLEDVLIMKEAELEELNPKFHGIRISARLGNRKKLSLIEIAREKGFHVLNINLAKEDMYKADDDESEMDEEETQSDEEEEVSLSKRDQIKKLKEKKPSAEADDKESESESDEDSE